MPVLSKVPETAITLPDGRISPAWQIFFTQLVQLNPGSAIPPNQGGTGNTSAPATGQIAVGSSGSYVPATLLPASAFPALTGDLSTPGGSLTTTLSTVNGSPGTYGTGTAVSTVTVNSKGLVTSSGSTNITGTVGAFTVATGFGCNGKTAQTSATANAAITATAGATYTATEQTMLNDLKALINQIRAALVANGIMV